MGRRYLFPVCSSVVKGAAWLGSTVLKWRAQSDTDERHLRKLLLTAAQSSAVTWGYERQVLLD